MDDATHGAERGCYVHVPFCRRRCHYCDFAVTVGRPDREFVDDVVRELNARVAAGFLEPHARFTTVFLGGGTPSALSDDALAQLLNVVERVPGAEVTVEANPEDLSVERVEAWCSAGMTRLSVGLQSLDDAVLAHLGRGHSAQLARTVLGAVRRALPQLAISVDLIFGDDLEDDSSWLRTLEGVVALEVDHVSAYGLTIEPGSRWRGRQVDDAVLARRYELADRVLGEAGFRWYEVSNWAKPGAACRHNRAYWRRLPYVGLGPSAHSYEAGRRSWNVASWPRWRARVRAGLVPTEGLEVLTPEQQSLEALYLALRSSDGIVPESVPAHLAEFFEDTDSQRVRLTLRGRLLADAIALELGRDRRDAVARGA